MDPNELSEFAKLIREGKEAKKQEEENKKKNFFEKYNIEKTEINPFSFISELAKLKQEAEQPQPEIVEEVVEELPPVVEPPKTASELLSELANLIAEGKKGNAEAFEAEKENLETFVAEVVQDIVELKAEEKQIEEVAKEEPVVIKNAEDELISKTVDSITKVAENTNLFTTTEPDKTSPNFKAIQAKLKSLEQWVSRISNAGPGSGSYWLNDLGDTDKTSLQNATDGQVLTFSADLGKWTAQDGGGGGGTVDTVARATANKASANTIITQGVDDTQNTRIGSVETSIISQTNSITNLQNVNLTQNTNIATVTGIAQAAFDKANTFVDTYTDQYARDRANGAVSLAQSAYDYANTIVDTYIDQVARDKANTAAANTIITQGVDSWQNNQITLVNQFAQSAYDKANNFVDTNADQFARDSANLALSIDVTQNTRIQSLETVNVNQNTTISIIQGVDLTQNTNITTANNAAWASFATANSAAANTIYLQGVDETQNTRLNALETVNINQNTSISIIQGIDATQNTRLNALETVNTNQNTSITIIQGVDTTQNTNITAADGKAQAAYDKANTSITTSGGTITGRLNVAYTPATTVNTAITITAANTLGGTGYADLFKFTNASGGATNPNKYIRINTTGELQVINSLYTAQLMVLNDAGDLTIQGNVISSGVKSGYSSARPGFRVYGSGTTSGLAVNQNTYGALNSNNFAVDYNQGSYLNTTNGVFTAPVAGLYQIYIVGRNAGNAAYSQLAVVKNATNGTGNSTGTSGGSVATMIEWAGSSTMNHAGSGTILQLAVGDTLALKVLAGTISFDGNDNWSVAYIG